MNERALLHWLITFIAAATIVMDVAYPEGRGLLNVRAQRPVR